MADENNMTDQSPPIQAQFAKGALEKIPQEIRDMIYTYAFIPETPHFCFHIKQRDDQGFRCQFAAAARPSLPSRYYGTPSVTSQIMSSPALGLLFVNHQLYREICEHMDNNTIHAITSDSSTLFSHATNPTFADSCH
ncbi:hypothetical protein Vi05172_g3291 [Venturia inaequalis]|nr:hypothetical protein Vi05172_g3291 [Venturia inaequalis]